MKWTRGTTLVTYLAISSGCAFDGDESTFSDAEEHVSSSSSPLSAHDWTAKYPIDDGNIYHNIGLAFIGDTAYAVITRQNLGSYGQPVYLSQSLPGTPHAWSPPALIPGVATRYLSIASFNGRLYMLTEGADHSVIMSRFDPEGERWSSSQLPFRSVGVPAVAAHDDRLFLLGSEVAPMNPIWLSSMDATGAFTPAQPTPLRGYNTALASYGGKLHAAYSSDAEPPSTFHAVRHSVFDGSVWGAPELIPTGFGSSVLRGTPALARYANGSTSLDCLHLVVHDDHAPSVTDPVWWSYSCGTGAFSVPVSIPGSSNNNSYFSPALAASSTRLLIGYRVLQVAMRVQSYSYPP